MVPSHNFALRGCVIRKIVLGACLKDGGNRKLEMGAVSEDDRAVFYLTKHYGGGGLPFISSPLFLGFVWKARAGLLKHCTALPCKQARSIWQSAEAQSLEKPLWLFRFSVPGAHLFVVCCWMDSKQRCFRNEYQFSISSALISLFPLSDCSKVGILQQLFLLLGQKCVSIFIFSLLGVLLVLLQLFYCYY